MSQNSVSDGCNSVESQLIDFGQKNGDQVLQLKCVEHGNVVTAGGGREIVQELTFPQEMAGLVIGRNGCTIKQLRASTCTTIEITSMEKEGNIALELSHPRVMARISGNSRDTVMMATQAIMNRIQSAYQPNQDGRQDHAVAAYPNATASVPLHETESCHQHNTQRSEPKLEKSGVMESMEIFMMGRIFASPVQTQVPCPSNFVGRLIGPKGSIIKDIMRRTQTSIFVPRPLQHFSPHDGTLMSMVCIGADSPTQLEAAIHVIEGHQHQVPTQQQAMSCVGEVQAPNLAGFVSRPTSVVDWWLRIPAPPPPSRPPPLPVDPFPSPPPPPPPLIIAEGAQGSA